MARVVSLVALIMVLLPQGAQGWWHRRTVQTAAYYYPAPAYPVLVGYSPVVSYPVPVVPYTPQVCTTPALAVATTAQPPVASPPAVPAVPNYAQPSTAPPSSGPAPYPGTSPTNPGPRGTAPTTTRGLKPIAATDRYFDSYVVAPPDDGTSPPRERQPVSFWNLTGHDAVMRVDGQNQTVPAGQRLQLVLGRQFVWQVDDREPQTGRLSDTGAGLDIMIRR